MNTEGWLGRNNDEHVDGHMSDWENQVRRISEKNSMGMSQFAFMVFKR